MRLPRFFSASLLPTLLLPILFPSSCVVSSSLPYLRKVSSSVPYLRRDEESNSSVPSPSDNEFVSVSGRHFSLSSGAPFLFAGTNNYYVAFSPKRMTDDLFDKARSMGITVVRSWAFSAIGSPNTDSPPTVNPKDKAVYFQYWDKQKGESAVNEGENGIKRLDYAVKAAKDRGIRLILVLTNNWADFGGLEQYNLWLNLKPREAFYKDERAKREYKRWLSYLVNRINPLTGVAYKDEPAIMAWELINEPRCKGCGDSSGGCPQCPSCSASSPSCSTDTITRWVDEMSTYLRSLDSNHLIAVGDEGFLRTSRPEYGYDGTEGDHESLVKLANIDFATVHCYPEHWGKDAQWGPVWVREHAEIAKKYGKPFIIEEFNWHAEQKDNPMGKEEKRNAFLDSMVRTVDEQRGYWAFWMLSAGRADRDEGPLQGLYPDYDGFTIYWQDQSGQVTPSGQKMRERAEGSKKLQQGWT